MCAVHWQGFWQSILGRTLSGGLYWPLWDSFRGFYKKNFDLHRDSLFLELLAGNSAGAASGPFPARLAPTSSRLSYPAGVPPQVYC